METTEIQVQEPVLGETKSRCGKHTPSGTQEREFLPNLCQENRNYLLALSVLGTVPNTSHILLTSPSESGVLKIPV